MMVQELALRRETLAQAGQDALWFPKPSAPRGSERLPDSSLLVEDDFLKRRRSRRSESPLRTRSGSAFRSSILRVALDAVAWQL